MVGVVVAGIDAGIGVTEQHGFTAGVIEHLSPVLVASIQRGTVGRADDEVLDFACGTGRLALDLAPHVARVLGIDFSAGMIAKARAKLTGRVSDRVSELATDVGSENVRFEVMDLFSQELDGQQFSVVTAFNVFHLLDDPVRYLQRLLALLSPGGLLISETPCLGRRPWYFRTALKLAGLTPWLPRVRFFTAQTLEALIASQDLEILEAKRLDEIGDPWIVARKP